MAQLIFHGFLCLNEGNLVLLHWPPTIPPVVVGWKCPSSSLPFTPMCSKLSIMLGPPPSIILATPPPPLWNNDVLVSSCLHLLGARSLLDLISWTARQLKSVWKRQILDNHYAQKRAFRIFIEVAVNSLLTRRICSTCRKCNSLVVVSILINRKED